MKKWLIALAALMLLTVFAVPAFAANTEIAITSSSSTVYANDEVTITVSVSSDVPYSTVGMTLSYDKQVLEFVSAIKVNTGAQLSMDYNGTDAFGFAFDAPCTYVGAFQTIVFRVKEGVTPGQTTIGGTPSGAANTLKPLTLTIGCNHNYTTWTPDNENTHTGTCANGCGVPKQEAHNWVKTGGTPAGCESPGNDVYTCTVCGRTKDVPTTAKGHAWDNDCDTTCNNGCGATRAATHNYSAAWTYDEKDHWHQCTVCGARNVQAAHRPGDPATETTAQLCKDCPYVITPALGHVHQFGDTWQQNSDYHWHVCTREGCHTKQDQAAHVYDNNCDLTCNTCGHIRVAPHEFGTELRGNEKGHWYTCILCQEPSEIIPHTAGEPATMDTPQVCTECQYWIKYPLSHVHTWGDTWESDDSNHWKACVECREASDVQPHAWDEGTILIEPTKDTDGKISFVCEECKAERTATIPKLEPDPTESTEPEQTQPVITPSDNSEEFPWWILIVAAGVLLLAGIALFVFEFIRSKKFNSHGKFSSK